MTSGGLPYNTPSPSAAQESVIQEPTLLDRSLDDAAQFRAGELLGRMGQGKVYLLEESPAALYLNGEQSNPRVRSTARQFSDVDVEAWLNEASSSSASPIRTSALHLSGEPLAHLSTAKVFTYATDFGAAPLGIEWINDTNLVLLFSDAQAALLAIAVLAKAGFDFEDDPLESRSAHHVPSSLLPLPNKELLPESAPSSSRSRHDPAPLAKGETDDSDLPLGLRPLARMDIRFAMVSDASKKGKASESKWYEKNGRDAGRDRAESDWSGDRGPRRGGGSRGGRSRETPYARPGARRRPQVTQDDLDRELEGLRSGEVPAGSLSNPDGDAMDVDMDAGTRPPPRSSGGGRGGRGGRGRDRDVGKDDLDRELDEMFAGRASR